MRKITASLYVRPGSTYLHRSELRTVQIRLSGKWLEAIGFKPGCPVYVYPMGNTITLSPNPPVQVTELSTLDELKAEFQKLGIPTERR
jgi:hypothetical protein